MGITTGRIVLNHWPHGFGSDGGWVEDYAEWLEGIFQSDGRFSEAAARQDGMDLFTSESRIQDVMKDPALESFGRLIFPVDLGLEDTLTLRDMGNRLIWYSHVNPERTVSIVNEMKTRVQDGETRLQCICADLPPRRSDSL